MMPLSPTRLCSSTGKIVGKVPQDGFDGWFPEPFRLLSLEGTELIVWINGRQGSGISEADWRACSRPTRSSPSADYQ